MHLKQPVGESAGIYHLPASADAGLQIEERPDTPAGRTSPAAGERLLFVAQKQQDGTYAITLTDEGIQTFETALGIADDLGGKTRISVHSTVADIMERAATRDELSRLWRTGAGDLLHRTRVLVLRRKLRGSEKPTARQAIISHVGKILIVAVIGLWALAQFVIAIQDIEAIPSILANVPSDILNLHPTSAFSEVGQKISDAGQHVLFGVLGACLTFVAARVIRPFDRLYRKDQLVPGERIILRAVSWGLTKIEKRRGD